jgi:TolB-like protein
MERDALPSAVEVRDQLARILSSTAFANAGRLSRLLTYVVDRTLAGEGDQLKEYVLGTEVFDRAAQYDPRIDSIVRVEARRLRGKLDEYYQGPGAGDPVIISMPRGSYVPVFAFAAPTALPPAVAVPEAPPVRSVPSMRWLLVAGFGAGVITVSILAGLWSRPGSTTAPHASSGPSIAVLPFQHFSNSAEEADFAARLTDGVTAELARIGTVSVASRTSASGYTEYVRPVREIAKTLGVELVMEASAVLEAGNLRVQARLVDGLIDRKVWVGEYSADPTSIPVLSRQIAFEAAAAAIKRKAAQ